MKVDMDKLKPGQVIGKALEKFYGMEGKIKIMANGINTKGKQLRKELFAKYIELPVRAITRF